jgi:N-acyl-D-aspartate/D-glutamate deacylase
MAYDVVIKQGTVVDGTGKPSYRADVAIQGDRIAEVGKISAPAKRTIDAGASGDAGLC